eukprot:20414-Eustigmatos_ZCMA.PRE.1
MLMVCCSNLYSTRTTCAVLRAVGADRAVPPAHAFHRDARVPRRTPHLRAHSRTRAYFTTHHTETRASSLHRRVGA